MHIFNSRAGVRRVYRRIIAVALLAWTVSALVATSGAVAHADTKLSTAQTQAGNFKVFLPLTMNGRGPSPRPGSPTPTPVDPTPGPVDPTPTPAVEGALYLTTAVKTASGSAQVDAQGGMHAAFVHYVSKPDPSPAVYAYCAPPAARCDEPANWKLVPFADDVRDVQLQLTPAGQPRLLLVTNSSVWTSGKDYLYAACDSACANRGQWRIVRVVSSRYTSTFDIKDDDAPQHAFALDPLGRPRFVFGDRNFSADPDHYGAYYMHCDADCTTAANWQETQLARETRYDAEWFSYPSLTFTREGNPRLVASVYAYNDDGTNAKSGLYYYACDTHCNTLAGWQRLFLLNEGSGSVPLPTWDVELDAADNPHVVLFTGGGADGGLDHQLIYITCSADCLNAASWKGTVVGLPVDHGRAPDIELDRAEHPRIAYTSYGGHLGYAWCNSACAAGANSWHKQTIETAETMEAANPKAIPLHCDTKHWHANTPALALDKAGNPRIAYDVRLDARCLYKDPQDPTKTYWWYGRTWDGVRWKFFPQP